eukprot:scaffold33364_cov146-Isochrysis_galbana.AAC.5
MPTRKSDLNKAAGGRELRGGQEGECAGPQSTFTRHAQSERRVLFYCLGGLVGVTASEQRLRCCGPFSKPPLRAFASRPDQSARSLANLSQNFSFGVCAWYRGGTGAQGSSVASGDMLGTGT